MRHSSNIGSYLYTGGFMGTTCSRNGTCSCLNKLRDELCEVRDKLFNTLKDRKEREKLTDDVQLMNSGVIMSLNGVLDKIDSILSDKATPLWTGLRK